MPLNDNRQESDYSRQTVNKKGLRTGYTTGSCAAAAAKAALLCLLTKEPPEQVTIHLPVGEHATLKVNRCQWITENEVLASVIKDGGDDPDATHGAEICVTVSSNEDGRDGVKLVRGPGVGKVTRPGTGIPVGEPAVTRVPRRMIEQSIAEVLDNNGLDVTTSVTCEISVPTGEQIAEKTTNARLGVLGGISILGSTGVVQPFSTASWRASVHLAIDVAATNHLDHLVLSTGTRSEEFARHHLDLPDMAYIEAGIFSGAALKRSVMRGVKRATQVGMVGKLSKMAMGYFVTHVAGNRVDTNYLADLAAQCGADELIQEEIRGASSARHFQEIAQANNLISVFPMMCQLVCYESQKLLGDDANALIIDTMCFDFDGTLLGHASTSKDGIPLI